MKDMQVQPARVAVLGLGYVGSVTAACLAHLGHSVVGVDVDQFKVTSLNNGTAPFYEPGLRQLIEETVAAGRLSATTSLAAALAASEMAIVCVGTPSERNGNLGLEALRRVTGQIAAEAACRAEPLTVVVRSTVFPGTCEEVVAGALAGAGRTAVVANPEFLREGMAVRDFLFPSLLVVGGTDPAAVERVAALYAKLDVEACRVSLRTAEMIKYACNCFHAVKIGFANEIGTLCARLGVCGDEVMETLCRDVKLNLSPAYLQPGFAFGGSCLPKDLRALVYRAARLDVRLPLLESVLPSNDEHLRRAMQEAVELPAGRIGVYGLAFKEETDDLRESPAVALIEHLIGKGRGVRVFDPHIRLEQIYGSNRNFVLSAIPHIGKLMVPDLAGMLEWAEALIVTQKPDSAAAARIDGYRGPVLDVAGERRMAKAAAGS